MLSYDQVQQIQAAVQHQRAGRIAEAVAICDRLLRAAPDSFDCLYLRGMLYAQQDNLNGAVKAFKRAAKLKPGAWELQYNLAVALNMTGRHADAVLIYRRFLEANPHNADARLNYATTLFQLNRTTEALQQYEELIAANPNFADAYANRGMVQQNLKRFSEALIDFDRAIALKPNFPEALVNRGNVLAALHRTDDALDSYKKAIALNPNFADAYNNAGNIYCNRGNYEEALEAYNVALRLHADDTEAQSMRLHAKMHLCDWSSFKSECSAVISNIKRGAPVYPFSILAFSSSPDDELRCARQFSLRYPSAARSVWRGEKYNHDRIRVAYVSSDFRRHAVASILAGMLEDHDKSKFEVTAISIGPDDGSEMRQRLQRAFEHFIDCQTLSDDEIAARIREMEIDILVDLNGYTAGARMGIFAQRASPLQVGYLGGTRGAPYIDYLIADRTIVTPVQRPYYAEKIIYLPGSFLPIDDRRVLSEKVHSRTELGLPEKGFVFCCFNNSYKIVPRNFDAWMRILKQVEGSVLWLREDKPTASANLRREAEARGIAGERLVFAPRMPSMEEHLGRHRAADLFLDTLPFNAHTTAGDALWAGLPVLTQVGETLPARVGASLLQAIGLPEMIVETEEEYEKIALELGTDPAKLEAIKDKLARNRSTMPLFNTALFTRRAEGAYQAIYRRYQEGLAPDDVQVDA
jgi:predicted O-linked N-acetylglucosamine transferase (SPINDLY family)